MPSVWRILQGVIVIGFLVTCAGFYERGAGFTRFLALSADRHDRELPAVRAVPHVHAAPGTHYDGEFYSQLATDPWLRDPALSEAMDNAPFRAHRILFSWTAYLFGLGQPASILNAYALQNVAAWLVLAWLMSRWLRAADARGFAIWAGAMLTNGLLISVRYALTDAPATLLVVAAAWAVERRRSSLAAAFLGASALGRETAFVGAGMMVGQARTVAALRSTIGRLTLALAPTALWTFYLWTLYGRHVIDGAGNIGVPFRGVAWKVLSLYQHTRADGMTLGMAANITALAGFTAQAGVIVWSIVHERQRSVWASLSVSFLLLACLLREAVWDGVPGAYTRVALPVALGAAVLLSARPNRSWTLIALVNLSAIAGLLALWRAI